MTGPLLEVRDLVKVFHGQTRRAVDGVSFAIAAGDTLGLVGESGCGKTTLARSILRLIEATSGSVRLTGTVLTANAAAMRRVHRQAQIVFQDSAESLTPWMTVGALVCEGLEIHNIAQGAAARERVHKLLDEVGLRATDASRYPDELSGGQRQRVSIARALAVEPKFIICDEAVSALDVSVQAQVLNLLLDLQRGRQLTYLFIAHNLAVVERVATHVAVMYAGRIVEIGPAAHVFAAAQHPYTRSLLSSTPRLPRRRAVS